jgi:threonine dehydrogenase-like Zn-dependent dehydrogenase
MEAIAVERGRRRPVVIERERPTAGAGEVVVRTLRVGVDGTDHEVIAGNHGEFPAGEEHIVLGHEAVGVVEDGGDTHLSEGDVVVPTIRRPVGDEGRGYADRGELDMAPEGAYRERGIVGAHGFMSEYFVSDAAYLLRIPASLAAKGILVEPLSVATKALELAAAARSSFAWEPESAVVLGNGSLGLLTLGFLRHSAEYDRLFCLGRRDRPDPTIDIIEGLGATYVDSRETPVPEIPAEHGAMDLVFEATGHAKHAFEAVDALAPNGVGALLGVPEPWEFEVDGGRLHRELVLHNKALVGSVNSAMRHFEAAAGALTEFPEWFFDDVVTGVYGVDDVGAAFENDDTTIKTAVQFSSYEERR